ncbi:hypothetical protein DFH28DRAFT_834424, partial [Melampsora americana]
MGQKGRVIKCPLGPKVKKSRPNVDPVGSSSQALAKFSVVESQSALANAEELNQALMENRNVTHEPAKSIENTGGKDSPSDANLVQDNLGDLHIDQSDKSNQSLSHTSSPTNTNEPGTPRFNMSFGE